MTTVALMLALQMPSHVEAPPGDVGEVRRDFRDTGWVAVRGYNGAPSIWHVALVFSSSHDVVTLWADVADGRQVCTRSWSWSYQVSPASGLPILVPGKEVGVVSEWENCLRLDIEERVLLGWRCTKPHRKLRLLLKRVK